MTRPLRVLEVIYRADRGGAETWLLHTLRHVPREKVAIDFLVHDGIPGAYDDEIRKRGARIFICEGHRNILRQWRGLREVQRRQGPYDVIHSHVDHYGGFVALLARLVGIRTRIISSHNNTRKMDGEAPLGRRLYLQTMQFLIRHFSSAGLGTSPAAAATMFGQDWTSDRRWSLLPACLDLLGFHRGRTRGPIRTQLGIPEDAVVVGHVGRFFPQKNHIFLVELAEKLVVRLPTARFLLVGEGPLRESIEAAIRERNLQDHFTILSARDDIPQLMLDAMDYFLFPSLYEGLGLALVEAQAAGLRCMASAAVPPEAIAVPSMVRQRALADGPEVWADEILRHLAEPIPLNQREVLHMVEQRFDIRRNAEQLMEIYMGLATKRSGAVTS